MASVSHSCKSESIAESWLQKQQQQKNSWKQKKIISKYFRYLCKQTNLWLCPLADRCNCDFILKVFSTFSRRSRKSLFSFCVSFRSFLISSESRRASANSETALKLNKKICKQTIDLIYLNSPKGFGQKSPIMVYDSE